MRIRFVECGGEWGCEILSDGRLYRARADSREAARQRTEYLLKSSHYAGVQISDNS